MRRHWLWLWMARRRHQLRVAARYRVGAGPETPVVPYGHKDDPVWLWWRMEGGEG